MADIQVSIETDSSNGKSFIAEPKENVSESDEIQRNTSENDFRPLVEGNVSTITSEEKIGAEKPSALLKSEETQKDAPRVQKGQFVVFDTAFN